LWLEEKRTHGSPINQVSK
jgi:hypothetical protein